MITLKRYNNTHREEWDNFICNARNATFLFMRGYMDYHNDRFEDHSLMFYRDNTLYALLPANLCDNTLYTHQGLTYGGVILGNDATTVHVMEVFECIKKYVKENNIDRIIYKAIPWIYHLLPTEEPLYAMHRIFNMKLLERDISTTICIDKPLKWKKDRRHGLRVAHDNGVTVCKNDDYSGFWEILTTNLEHNHGVKPVHTISEIQLLHNRFPDNIILYEARMEGILLGGCVVYVTPQVVHTQYIAATPQGKRLGVVNAIIDTLLHSNYPNCRYIDFGKSTELHSDILNENLIYQKEGFGGRGLCYDTYELSIVN